MLASKHEFKVGDRVSVTGHIEYRTFKNNLGTIVDIDTLYRCSLEVEFDNWDEGHDGSENDGVIKNRWYIPREHHKKVKVIESVVDVDPIIDVRALLPYDPKERKEIPLASGLFDYFPSALIEVAKVSFKCNQQHNPGEPLHWSQEKSTDHHDTLLRHMMERGTFDTDGQRHSAKIAWRALAALQMEMQNEGYPKARGSK